MSQAKVDQYKKEKANRKEILAKEKRQKMITKICTSVVLVVLAGWIGVSAVEGLYESRPKETYYVETTEIDEFLNSLYEEETTEK